jgi:hypothetical protein
MRRARGLRITAALSEGLRYCVSRHSPVTRTAASLDGVALADAWQRLEHRLASDDPRLSDEMFEMAFDASSDESAEQLLIRERFWPFPQTRVDWKTIDSVNAFPILFPEAAEAFDGFHWDGEALGEDIEQGFAAASRWLKPAGLQMFSIYSGGDTFQLGIVPLRHLERLQQLAAALHIGISLL